MIHLKKNLRPIRVKHPERIKIKIKIGLEVVEFKKLYLKIHPLERPEHGLEHSEDEVGPTEKELSTISSDISRVELNTRTLILTTVPTMILRM